MSTQERNRARTLRNLLEANANWNAERRRHDGPSLSQLVDTTSTIDPELRKELPTHGKRDLLRTNQRGRSGTATTSVAETRQEKVGRH